MKDIIQIRRQIQAGKFEFSRHAFLRVIERNISEQDIRAAGVMAEIIEEYPDDKYSPSALLLGFAQNGRPLHFQVSLIEEDVAKIITVYEPDEKLWIEFRKRR